MGKEMTEYDIRKMERLERYESTVQRAVETIDLAISWLWAILIIAVPVFLFFKPLEVNGTIQGVFGLVLLLFIFLVALVWRSLGKINKD